MDDQDTIELVWDDGMDSNPSDWRPTARAHCIAIKFLQQAISKSYVEKKHFPALLEGHMTKAVCTQLGDLEQIVCDHGSISTALANALSSGITNAEDMSALQGRLARFERQIQEFVNEALISKEYLLGLITQVLDVAQEGTQRSMDRIVCVKQLFNQGIRQPWGLHMQTSVAPPLLPTL